MLIDSYQRKINYLRISVTDRCNLRCVYCMPENVILQKKPQEILSFEEITQIVKLAVSVGIDKIKITGGEPLVRKSLPRLLELLSFISGLKDLSLTTNGVLLHRYVLDLKSAGLKKINISMDTLDDRKFKYIARFDRLADVLKGIDAALKESFFIKLNVVIMKGLNDDEILRFVRFAQERRIITRFIELMPTVDNIILNSDLFMSCDEIKDRLKSLGKLTSVLLEDFGNGPAQYYKIEGVSTIVGFISPMSCRFCFACNRLRLTVDGFLMPCLSSKMQFDLKTPLRENKDEEVLNLIKNAAFLKPQGHNFNFSSRKEYLMSQIGG